MDNIIYDKFLNAANYGASGSIFETIAETTAGSNAVAVEDVGDFAVGQEVLLTRGYQRHVSEVIFDRKDTSPINRRPWKHGKPLEGRVELLGNADEEWVTYIIDFNPNTPSVLRWTKDYGRNWQENIEISNEPIDLDGKVRVKVADFAEREWGATAVIVSSSRLVATIERREGNKIYRSETANESAGCTMRHSDSAAIQRAIDAAIAKGKGVFLPNGRCSQTSISKN